MVHCALLPPQSGTPLGPGARPKSANPPMNAARARFASLPIHLPLPKGNSAIQLALIWCLRSKSEAARRELGSQALITWPPSPPSSVIRFASDEMSIDFENV